MTLWKYLIEVMKKSHHCQHCALYHPELNSCFFAYECIKDDFRFKVEEDDYD